MRALNETFDEGISCHDLIPYILLVLLIILLSLNSIRIIREHPDKQVPMIVDWWLSGGIVARQQTKRNVVSTTRLLRFMRIINVYTVSSIIGTLITYDT